MRNKNLLEENENLKQWLAELADKNQEQEFKQLNNEEIRQWIISILINDYSASDMDAKAIDAVMCHCNQECWSKFCEWNPTEAICRNMIFYTYKFNHYWNLTGKLYSERNKKVKMFFFIISYYWIFLLIIIHYLFLHFPLLYLTSK